MEKIANFVKSHPGFYVRHTDRGVTMQIEWVNVRDSSRGVEYVTVRSVHEARTALGY